VLSLRNFRDTKIIIKSKIRAEFKNIGYLISSNKRDFKKDAGSFKVQLLPFQQKQITINPYVDYLSKDGLKINLQTQENYK
jgi:ribosomal protein S8